MSSSLPALVAFVPLTCAAILAAVSSKVKRLPVDVFTILTCTATLGLTIALQVEARAHRAIHFFSGWRLQSGAVVGVAFVVDQAAAAAVVLIAILALGASVFSWRYLESGKHHFHVLMLLFTGGMLGFAMSGDFFILFVFFELMSVAAYALTGLKIGELGPLQGAINFAVVNSVGSFALLLGIGLIYGRTGALNFAQVQRALTASHPDTIVVVCITLMFAGLLTKAAVVPFHFWLDDAHAVAPTPVCVLFSGIMVELGLYGVARIYWAVFHPSLGSSEHAFGLIIVGAGVASAIVGAVMCFAQQHLKRLLAFSTISHVGIATVGVGLMSRDGIAGAALYIAGHGLIKAGLFVLVGVLLHRFATVDEEQLHGEGRASLVTGIFFAIGGLALAGLPPFALDRGKGLIEHAAAAYPWMPWVFGAAEAITGAAVLRVAAHTFIGWGRPTGYALHQPSYAERGEEQRETTSRFAKTPAVLIAPAIAFICAGLVLGLLPNVGKDAQRLAARFQDTNGYAGVIYSGRDTLNAVETHPVGKRGDWYGLASAAAAVMLAAGALWQPRSTLRARGLGRALLTPLVAVRRAHSGHVGDYVMWFTVGLATYGGACLYVIH